MKQAEKTKTPKTVTVAVLVPWMIVLVFLSVTTGLISGYFLHSNMIGDARAEVKAVQAVPVAATPSK